MAKFYILTEEHIKSGLRPKTPRQKQRDWAKVCGVLTLILMVENLWLLNMWISHHG